MSETVGAAAAPPPARQSASSGRTSGATVWPALAALTLLTIVLRLPAFSSSRHLVFDDGTYGVSVLDMRHGLAPYRGVFSAQGPLHFPLLYAGDLLGFRTLDGPRVMPLLAGVLATLASWAVARRIAGSTAGLIAGALVATSGSMIWTTGQVTGDGIASAIAVTAVWTACAYRDDPRLGRALLTGVVMGAALAVKPLVATAALPVGWWLWSRRRLDHLAAAVGAAVVVWFASALPWGLSRVWEQSVEYNRGAGPRFSKVSQLRKLSSTLSSRDLLVVGTLVLALVTVVATAGWLGRGVAGRISAVASARRGDVVVIATWAAVTAFVLVLEPALYRNHLATIVPPLAVLAAILVRTPRVLAVLLVLLIPWSVANLHDILWPTGYRGDAAELMRELEALPHDAWVISDEPGFVYRAGLRTPALLNDPSQKRIDQQLLTTDMVADAAADPRVCAVVVWSPRFARELPGLAERLAADGLEPRVFGGDRTLWLRPDC
jgi:4-amino-4-deoxy-L-arabinose transferase-like glycosyltransferase